MAMRGEILITADGVSKKFCRDLKTSLLYGARDLYQELLGRQHGNRDSLRAQEFWAIRNVSFTVRRGECLGLIGRNGAGKTTLLRMLNGLIKPDTGEIEIRGKVGALIALGAGFSPVLTGRENIYVNASVLGFSKRETDNRLEEIVAFADLAEFIDMPVQSYSSGMAVRLGFSIASTLEPDILLLDEVLAVGDVGFRMKCYNRIFSLAERSAVVFVSHAMPQVERLSTSVAFLGQGAIQYLGTPSEGIDRYNRAFEAEAGDRRIAEGVSVSRIIVNGQHDPKLLTLTANDAISISWLGVFPARVQHLEVVLTVLSIGLDVVAQFSSRHDSQVLANSGREQRFEIVIPDPRLGSGPRLLSLAVVDADTNNILFWAPGAWKLLVTNPVYIPSPSLLRGTVSAIGPDEVLDVD